MTEGSAGTGGAPVPAAVMAVSAWILVVLSVAAFVRADPGIDSNQLFFLVDVVGAAVYGTVAGVVLARRVHPVPIIMGLTAIGVGLAALSYSCSQLAVVRPGLPWVDVLSPLQNTAWIPGTLSLFLIVPWLIRDHPLGVGARLGVLAGIAATAWYFWSRTFTEIPAVWVIVPVLVVGSAAAADCGWRWRHGPPDERVGLGWMCLGTALMTAAYIPLALPASLPGLWVLNPLVHLAVQAFYPVAILVCILRQRMWGLNLAVSRATVAGTLTVLLLALYVVVATAVTALLPEGDSVGAQVVAAGVVAVAVQPVRLWLQRRVHRLVYGEGADPARAVRTLGRQFGSAETPEQLLEGLAAGVGVALRLESVSVRRTSGVAAVWGSATGHAESVELVHRGAALGTMVVTAPPGESLGARTRRSLTELSAVVTAGLVVLQSAENLQEARRRLASVRLEERQMIRRELHDGLGPSLAGIRLGLQGARNLLGSDPAAAAELIGALQEQLDHQVEGVRQLSRSMFPPVLDELGLVPALHELAANQSRSGFRLRVQADPPPRLGAEIGAAAYGIVVEAVTNARRHSGADGCRVDATFAREMLTVVIHDDGCGFDPTGGGGVGTRSMRERAHELGGTLHIESARPTGTVVTARLPLTAS
ncbi:sensor histidine kinase [Rhodococcus opacus]|uniref:Sensor histidine kinase n=1 Tax=Rhodococcus opacus TaxID=37919 RepID=A0AAX3YI55_RHOOP|nr:sensor histidine kinase [Rhodococcus opacus]MCZ4583956.1 sensor histidine kinase [Rhodococcus opacus]NHU43386.1 sensor histidine kinase [Rhodococcus sp. A14]WLF47911.1 sensor histidine kinase [Rhodococcus opacus]